MLKLEFRILRGGYFLPEARFFADLAGYTLDIKMQFKQRLLSVTLEDLRRVAKTDLSGEAAMAVISSEEKVKEANVEMGNIFSVAAI